MRSINNISRGGYITLEVLNILSNLFNFLRAKLLKRSSYTAIRSISIVVRVVRNNLQRSNTFYICFSNNVLLPLLTGEPLLLLLLQYCPHLLPTAVSTEVCLAR